MILLRMNQVKAFTIISFILVAIVYGVTALDAPSGLRADWDGEIVALSWQTPSSDYPINRYDVYRDGFLLTTISGNPPATSLGNIQVAIGTSAEFQVKAFDVMSDQSPLSAVLRVTTYPTVKYTGSSGGNWHDAANWQGGVIPTAQHVAEIGATTVVINADATAHMIRCSNSATPTIFQCVGGSAASPRLLSTGAIKGTAVFSAPSVSNKCLLQLNGDGNAGLSSGAGLSATTTQVWGIKKAADVTMSVEQPETLRITGPFSSLTIEGDVGGSGTIAVGAAITTSFVRFSISYAMYNLPV